MKTGREKNSDIHMNTKLIHYDQCYYNEHKINSSQWNTQSTTYLLQLLTKNNRTIILHQGDTRGHGHCQHVRHTKVFPSLGIYQNTLQGGSLSIIVRKAKDVKTKLPMVLLTSVSVAPYQGWVGGEAKDVPRCNI